MKINKYKVYVDSEDEVPDDYEAQTGANGGIYYEKPTGGADSDESDSTESQTTSNDDDMGGTTGFSDLELQYGGYSVDTNADPTDVVEGDSVFVEHSDGDYIADIESVSVNGEDDWSLTFNGSYEIRPDTASDFLGIVEDEPDFDDLPANMKRQDIGDVEELSQGDLVTWSDPGGHELVSEIESAGTDAVTVVSGDYLKSNELEQKISEFDPAEEYDVSGDFGEEFAWAVEDGNVGEVGTLDAYNGLVRDENVQDVDLLKDALAQEQDGKSRKSMVGHIRKAIEKQGGTIPQSPDVDYTEVPEKRKGTEFGEMTSKNAIDSGAAAMHSSWGQLSDWTGWNDALDSMTDEELEEAFIEGWTSSYQGFNKFDDRKSLSANDFELGDEQEGVAPPPNEAKDAAPLVTRMDSETARNALDRIQDSDVSPGKKRDAYRAFAAYSPDADFRREVYEESKEEGIEYKFDNKKAMEVQFGDVDEVKSLVPDIHTSSTKTYEGMAMRAMMGETGMNDGKQIGRYNAGRPIASIESTEALENGCEELREETSKHLEEQYDGSLRLFRGTDTEITDHCGLESWTTSYSTADGFGSKEKYGAVLSTEIEPGDALYSHEIHNSNYESEKEWGIMGGAFYEDEIENIAKSLDVTVVKGTCTVTDDPAIIQSAIDEGKYTPSDVGFSVSDDDSSSDADEIAQTLAERASEALPGDVLGKITGTGQATYGGAEMPVECRECGDARRIDGKMVCPDCADDVDKAAVDRVYVGSEADIPEGAEAREGQQGGMYYIPGEADEGEEDPEEGDARYRPGGRGEDPERPDTPDEDTEDEGDDESGGSDEESDSQLPGQEKTEEAKEQFVSIMAAHGTPEWEAKLDWTDLPEDFDKKDVEEVLGDEDETDVVIETFELDDYEVQEFSSDTSLEPGMEIDASASTYEVLGVEDGEVQYETASGYQSSMSQEKFESKMEGGEILQEGEAPDDSEDSSSTQSDESSSAVAVPQDGEIDLSDKGAVELADVGANPGVSAQAMNVAVDDEGNEYAYVTDKSKLGDDQQDLPARAMATYAFSEMMGQNVPKHQMTESGYAVAAIEGEPVWTASSDMKSQVEKSDFVEQAAIQFIAGNRDIHQENALVGDDGELYMFDLDHSAGTLDEDIGMGNTNANEALSKLASTAESFDFVNFAGKNDFKDEIVDKAEEMATQIKYDEDYDVSEKEVDEALTATGAEDAHEYADNILENIDMLATGQLDLE